MIEHQIKTKFEFEISCFYLPYSSVDDDGNNNDATMMPSRVCVFFTNKN
jgi:hypothetical protein